MSARPTQLLLLTVFAGCVSYERDDATVQTIAAEIATRTGGTFSFDDAVDLAMRQNAELRAAEVAVRAADAATTVPLTVRSDYRGRPETIEILIDPVELLGLGPRGAMIEAAEARHVQAVAELANARWRVIAAIAEEFAIHAALAQLQVPDLQLDVDAFESAGLASAVAAQQLRAAQAKQVSEQAELDRAHSDNLARLRELLGLPGNAALQLTPLPDAWLRQPDGRDSELLTRPDLAVAVARFRVADRKFRQAVAEQYPTLRLGPNISLIDAPLRAMGMLFVPVAMHGRAKAAQQQREAMRVQLEAAYLAAHREASLREQQLVASAARAAATRLSLQASVGTLDAARTAFEVELSAFGPFSNAAVMVMRNTMEHRRAAIDHARAMVRRAKAWGWPGRPLRQEVTQ